MAKHFKPKKVLRRLHLIKYVFIILFAYLLIRLCIYSLTFISPVSYYYPKMLIIDYFNLIKDNTINKPVNLLNYEKIELVVEEEVVPVVKEEPKENEETEVPKEEIKKNIYIYSSHQTEKYSDNKTVVKASKYLKSKLEEKNINVVVEEGSIQEFLIANNYSYNYSYVASRYFIKEELEKNNYDLIIDLHRDAVSRNASLVTIDGKKYAKVMFVIGKKNKNYKKNYKVAQTINNMIKAKYPTLTRGILLQSGSNVNGIYNQDLNKNMILIELGGNQNTYKEVQNTIDLIAPIIGEYLNEKEI